MGEYMRSAMRTTAAIGAALVVATGVGAKPTRSVKRPPTPPPPAAAAQVLADPGAPGMMTPKEVQLRPTTPAEAQANAVWSTRAALNIAALQCQFSPYLATVRNYNDFLRQHADELDRARTTMVAHFKRYDATQAQNSFDRYTTQTYNSYSTLDAQYSFCDEAGLAGRQVLTVRKGDLSLKAATVRDRIRAALIPVSALALIKPIDVTPVTVPIL